MAKKEIRQATEEGGEQPAFESAMARLEEIAAEMESGELSLEALLAHYEEGLKLSKVCAAKLDAAELRIRQVTEDATGNAVTARFGAETARKTSGGAPASATVEAQGETDDEVSLF